MKITLPKPKIVCPECGSIKDLIGTYIEGRISKQVDIFTDCNNCGADIDIEVFFEEEPHICNCDICKKIKGIDNK